MQEPNKTQETLISKTFIRMERIQKKLWEMDEMVGCELRMLMMEDRPAPDEAVTKEAGAMPMLFEELHSRLADMETVIENIENKLKRIRL